MQEVWTLCRIFKRTPSTKKYRAAVAAAAWKVDDTIKQNGADSKACSSMEDESENSNEQCMSFFGESVVPQNPSKLPNIFMDQVDAARSNYFLLGGHNNNIPTINSVAQQVHPFAATYNNYPSFWNHPSGDIVTNGNWDELSPVVEPYPWTCHSFDCT